MHAQDRDVPPPSHVAGQASGGKSGRCFCPDSPKAIESSVIKMWNVIMVLAASGVLPGRAMGQSTDADVIIIRAGIAGLQAAHVLRSAGWAVLILEAANRIGGRAVTDTTTLGQPFDLGCSWINADDKLFFAGETVADPYAALCSGAYYSGQAQAEAVIKALGS